MFIRKIFSTYDKIIPPILLNAENIEQDDKKVKLTNTFDVLLEIDVISIVNENDSVVYTEIELDKRLFGNNDIL